MDSMHTIAFILSPITISDLLNPAIFEHCDGWTCTHKFTFKSFLNCIVCMAVQGPIGSLSEGVSVY